MDARTGGDATRTASPSSDWPSPRRAWYALTVLTLGLMVATLDRSVLGLLSEPIKRDLGISDTQFSLLVGFAFVFFYAILGLPIARLADRGSRRLIIGIGMAFWSIATALCGLATTFWQMFWARVGVGAGESSFAPATYSIVTDSFPPEKLAHAIAILGMGFSIGNGFTLMVGSALLHVLAGAQSVEVPLLGEMRTWQAVFVAIGIPGVLLAFVMATVQEPRRRGRLIARDAAAATSVPVRDILRFVNEDRKTFVPMFVAMGIKTLLNFGSFVWVPALFVRTHDWSIPRIGFAQGLIWLVGSPLGMLAGSWLSQRYARRGRDDANMRVLLIATTLSIPTSIAYPLVGDAYLAIALYAVNNFVLSLGIAPANAALQLVTPNEMRSQVRAAYQFVFNVVGWAGGPLFVALFTDYVFGRASAVGYSLALAAVIVSPIAALITWYGLKPYAASLVRSRSWA